MADEIDPLAEDEEAEQAAAREADTEQAELIRQTQHHYFRLFSGNATPDDVDFVMRDLARYCSAYTSDEIPTRETLVKLPVVEGRRQVFWRIMDFARLSHDDLFRRYRGSS